MTTSRATDFFSYLYREFSHSALPEQTVYSAIRSSRREFFYFFMKGMSMIRQSILASALAVFSALTPALVKADPHCNTCPYSCQDLGLNHKECSQISNANGVCCVDLTKKGLAVAQAYDRVKSQAPAATQDRCPSGFQPSEQKCSVEERRRGCKDMRLPSGLGCVRR